MAKMVEIVIPMADDGARERFVSVNGYSAKIQIGKPVKVPDYVAKMLQNRDRQIAEAETRRNKLANE